MKSGRDTFGQALLDAFEGGDGHHAIERDDGRLDWTDATQYVDGPKTWRSGCVQALDSVRGRVLDVGCGAGRHAAYLQAQGCDVIGMDTSEGAVEICRRRGIPAVLGALGQDDLFTDAQFDAVVMLGNNLGLLASPLAAPGYLLWLASRCRPSAILVGEGLDPTRIESPEHLGYHRKATAEGRRPGQMRLRVIYEDIAGDWFSYWQLSQPELQEVVRDTPWSIETVTADVLYVATLRLG